MEEISDDKKRFKSIVSALQKSVECPVCLETVKPPFKVCVRGHSVCLECIKKLEKCPLCQEIFTFENLVCFKNVLEALPRFCCYSDAGCEEVVEPGNDHEMFCGYRPIVCQRAACSTEMPVVQMLDHYKSNYPEALVVNKMTHSVVWTLTTKLSFFTPVSLFNNLFWINHVEDDTELKIFFLATPIGKLKNDYYVRIEFKKEEMVYIYTVKAQVLSDCKRKFEGKKDAKYCMKIPREELYNFFNDQGKVAHTLYFFEKKPKKENQ